MTQKHTLGSSLALCLWFVPQAADTQTLCWAPQLEASARKAGGLCSSLPLHWVSAQPEGQRALADSGLFPRLVCWLWNTGVLRLRSSEILTLACYLNSPLLVDQHTSFLWGSQAVPPWEFILFKKCRSLEKLGLFTLLLI